ARSATRHARLHGGRFRLEVFGSHITASRLLTVHLFFRVKELLAAAAMDWRIVRVPVAPCIALPTLGAPCTMRTFMKHKIKTQLAACALAGAAFSGSALGAIVCASPNLP